MKTLHARLPFTCGYWILLGLSPITGGGLFVPRFTDIQFRRKIRICRNAFYGLVQMLRLAYTAACSDCDSIRVHEMPFESTIPRWAANLSTGYYLLGDLAYPLRIYLLTPLRNITSFGLDSMQERYNFSHSSLRMSVECCIGVLKGRLRRLRYSQNLSNGKTVSVNTDSMASICIHNFCRAQGQDTGDDYRLENEQDRISSAEPDTVPFDRTLFPDYDKSKEVTAQIFRSTVMAAMEAEYRA